MAIADAATSWSKIQVPDEKRTVVAEFDGERVVGQSWPARDGHVVYLELTD